MRKLTGREKRLLVGAALAGALVAWDFARRRWEPDLTVETAHYLIYSTATPRQTREIGVAAEMLYRAYGGLMRQFDDLAPSHQKLKLKLFKDRDEFRFCNRIRSWAEAFYREPYCYQYYSAGESNPYHWMLHEATHQLNREVAGLHLENWLEEGISCYLSTARISHNELSLGEIDTCTYPTWWIHDLATTGDLERDIVNGSVIPIRAIVTDSGGPDIDTHFNLYYLHWWSLTHFLMHYEDGKYRGGCRGLIEDGGTPEAFEKHIGPIEDVQGEWYGYVLDLKDTVSRTATPPVALELDEARP